MPEVIRVQLEGERELIQRLQRIGVSVGKIVEAATLAGAEVVRREASSRAPGPFIGAETTQRSGSQAVVDVGPDKKHWYYRFSESGSKSHIIRPKRKKALAFSGDHGERIVRRQVRHPGYPARPFLQPAMDAKRDEASKVMGDQFKKALED